MAHWLAVACLREPQKARDDLAKPPVLWPTFPRVWQNERPIVTQQSEIEALRAQLESLERRSREKSAGSGGEEPSAASRKAAESSPELEGLQDWVEQLHLPELSEKLSEYLAALGQDVKDSKPRALVSAFVAGFLAGKVMSR